MTLYLTSGPSGSGKSTYYETHKDVLGNPALVCPDDIREEINGDVSDQRNGKLVWDTAYQMMDHFLSDGDDVFFSATFCSKSSINNLVKKAVQSVGDDQLKVVIFRFKDGKNLPLLISRVTKDLDDGKNRSNTLVTNEDGETVVENQWKRWMEINWDDVKHIADNHENVTIQIREV